MATLYVNNNTGDDARTYVQAQNQSTPWATIGRAAWGSTNRSAPNAAQAAQAGDTVVVAAGTYSTVGTNLRSIPAYNPVNTGSAGNPITFQASGTVVLTLSSGEGPVIGSRSRSYIVWDGFRINGVNAPSTSDTGHVDIFNSDHCTIKNCTIIGDINHPNTGQGNYNAIRIEASNDTLIQNCLLGEIAEAGVYGGNQAVIMLYDSNRSIIEHNDIYKCGNGVYVKGIHEGSTQQDTIIRLNKFTDCRFSCVDMLGCQGALVYQNIGIAGTSPNFGVRLDTSLGAFAFNIDIYNNVWAGFPTGISYRDATGTPRWTGIRFWNNIVYSYTIDGIHFESVTAHGDTNHQHNIYFGPLGSVASVGPNLTLAQWQALNEDNVVPLAITSNPLFVNAGASDYHLQSGSPAQSLGRTFAGATVPAGAYITGTETIGRGATSPGPTAPAFTSSNSTAFTVGTPGSFSVTTNPAASTLTRTGSLPAGVTFTDNLNGTATIAGNPAAGTGGTYTLTITATNSGGSVTQTFTLNVRQLPVITSASSATFTTGTAGTFTVTTTGFPAPSLSRGGVSLPSGVTFTDNGNGTGTLSGTPAAGTGGTYALTFTATNAAGSTSPQSFTLTVRQAPAITSASSTTFTVGSAGTFTVTATGFPVPSIVRGGTTLPSGVTFTDNGNGTGTLAGTPGTGVGGTYTLTFQATNAVGNSATQTFTLTVRQLPAITSANSATFPIGSSSTFSVTTSGFPAPSIARGGSLPSGVTFVDNGNGTGTLSGTPAAGTAGTYPLTFTPTNVAGSGAAQNFTLTVPAVAGPTITSAASTTFQTGVAGTFTVTTSGSPTPSITRGGALLPSGVTFTDNGNGTGTLAGTPAGGTGGTYSITFTATNANGSSSPQAFTLTVHQAPVITSATSATFNVGSAGSHLVTATGYPTPTISIGGTLPSGVTFSGGVLSGTPAAGTGGSYPLTFVATSAAGTSPTQNFTLTVRQAPAITSAASATFTVGQAATFTITTTGYPPPTVTRSGTLPSGLSFLDNGDGTATIFGTPAAGTGGAYSLSINATNVLGSSGAQSFTLTVRQLPAFTSAPSVTFPAGVLSTFNITTSGFPAPSIARVGALPSGVTFTDLGNGTARLQGTPLAASAGSYVLTLTATNAAGSTPQSFTLVISAPGVPAFTSAASTNFTVGTPGSFTVTTNPPATTITSSGGAGNGGTPSTPPSISTSLLPADFQTVWAPGIRGIPVRNTIFATVDPATYGNGTIECSAAINALIQQCPAGQVIKFLAGTFLINDFLLVNKAITLRGSGIGPNGTRLLRTDTNQEQIIIVGPSRFPRIDESTAVNLTSDAIKGQFSVTVTSAAGFAPGQFVKLDEDDYTTAAYVQMPARIDGSVQFALQSDRLSWPIHNPPNEFGDLPVPDGLSWHSRQGRPLSETKEIASVSGNTITFTTPIHARYYVSKLAQLTRYTGSDNVFTTYAGVEDLVTDGGCDGNISFLCAAYSWVRNVEVKNYGNPGIDIKHGYRLEIRDSYIHDTVAPRPGGGGYAFSMQQGASEVLIENNIIINANKVMVSRSAGAGSVVGYNYCDDAWIDYNPVWQEVGLNGSHMIGSHHILFEGNRSFNYDCDDTWGSCIYMTAFRNLLTGQRRSFTDTDNVRCVGLAYGSWWHAIIGNVLGVSGGMSGWVYQDPGDGTYGNTTSVWGVQQKAVLRLGYAPGIWQQSPDPLVASRSIKDGNYDYLTASAHWDRAVQSIPDSLYLSSKPSFFSATQTWPWVDALGGTKTYELPAYQRYQAILAGGDTMGGGLPAGLTFTDNGNGTATIAGTPAPGTAGTYNLTLTATNITGSATQNLTLTVRQIPAFTSVAATTMTVGVAASFRVTTSGNPLPALSRTGSLPSGISFTDNGDGTGTLAGTPGGGTAGTYNLTFTATNAAGSAQQAFVLTVMNADPPPAPIITSAASTTFTVGTPGNFSVTTSPAAQNLTRSGNLPSGVSFVDNGGGSATLSGTPAAGQGGIYTFTITATNAGGTDVQSFTLTVRQAPVITSPSSASFAVGVAGSFLVTTTGYPAPSISRGGVGLPSGLSFTDNGNGTATLSGTPGVGTGGSYAITFTATNAAGSTPAQSFDLTVIPADEPPPVFTSPGVATFTVGSPGTFSVTTSPAADTLTRSGTLPTGVNFVDNGDGTGTLSGTPGAGTGRVWNFTIIATNSGGTASQAFSLVVHQLPAITSASATTFRQGKSGTFNVVTTGYPAPALTATGTLPPGVTFTDLGNGRGRINGNPSTSGTYPLVITATNVVGSVQQNFALTVRPRGGSGGGGGHQSSPARTEATVVVEPGSQVLTETQLQTESFEYRDFLETKPEPPLHDNLDEE